MVGRLSHEVGWKYKNVVRTLETRRKLKLAQSIRKKQKMKEIRKAAKAKVNKQTQEDKKVIVSYGYN